MRIAGTTRTTSGASSSDRSGEIAALQKQLRELTERTKSLADSDLDEKTKQKLVQMLMAQMQVIMAQIAALQTAQQQEQSPSKADGGLTRTVAEKEPGRQDIASGLGRYLDIYV
jgi:hypothetical protein